MVHFFMFPLEVVRPLFLDWIMHRLLNR